MADVENLKLERVMLERIMKKSNRVDPLKWKLSKLEEQRRQEEQKKYTVVAFVDPLKKNRITFN